MMVNMRYNESVKTFDDIVHHLELEVEQLMVIRPNEQVYVVESNFTTRKKVIVDIYYLDLR